MVTSPKQQTAFSQYLTVRFNKALAITPGDKKEVIAALKHELIEEGRVPLPIGSVVRSVKIDPRHPIVKAALKGLS